MRNERHQENQLAKNEFQKRKPSDKELEIAKKGLEIRMKSRNKPLSLGDKIYCFLIPFTATKDPFVNDSKEISDEYERQLDEFEMYGETRRVEELKKWQTYARITHFSLFGLLILIGVIFFIISVIRQVE
ncbi:hypothetical protein [Maribellus maritimus]|uniref:hypothetical protein n=1 Tax=Maribellus maritimus TaxID=2870838 RepID=UPI001EECB681|nr:hypothetical protein [Maribellus maritimus]MCG6191464.1 hypothetical protein [Maribellus maritimus]